MLRKLQQPVDNAPLILFRIFFGLVFLFESLGSFYFGWINANFVNVIHNFSFIGFEWLAFLNSEKMYIVFALMAIASIMVTIGFKYRWAMFSLFILWGMVYFAQKTSYNNHYYLMWLITFIMLFLPANTYASVDAKLNPKLRSLTTPRWTLTIFIVMISFVYGFATLAKFYPDWLDATVTRNMFLAIKKPEFLQPLFQKPSFHQFIAYAGIFFDGLIIPALLFRRTRWFAIIASLIFHIFNSITLHIGVFPYFSLCFSIFFFKPEQIRAFFFRKKPQPTIEDLTYQPSSYDMILKYIIIPFALIQFALPLRHWAIKGDVLWTEEGHRLSWRMMLRNRSGEAKFKVVDKNTKETFIFDNSLLLNEKQRKRLNTSDVIWQMAQKIKAYYALENKEVEVYCHRSRISINGKSFRRYIDPTVDLTKEKWPYFKAADWILEPNPPLKTFQEKVPLVHQPLQM